MISGISLYIRAYGTGLQQDFSKGKGRRFGPYWTKVSYLITSCAFKRNVFLSGGILSHSLRNDGLDFSDIVFSFAAS